MSPATTNGSRRQKAGRMLKLLRIEPADGSGLDLVFQSDGEEQAWRLENTSITEFLALLLRGRMHRGRRIFLTDAELALEPPEDRSEDSTLCLTVGEVQLCAPVDRAGARALKAEIDRSLKKQA